MAEIDRLRLRTLSPTAFENLVFDLARSATLGNLTWRTPGADGGRDIEGEAIENDFSGHQRRVKWLIECKRYAKSISWPTIWNKIAYGDSGAADFLLIAATATFTPRCLDEIQKWNALDRKPKIRCWPIHELEFRLSLNLLLAHKYGLIGPGIPPAAITDLSLHLARMCQSSASYIATGTNSDRHIQAASALSELLFVRSLDLREVGFIRITMFLENEAWPPFVLFSTQFNTQGFDRVGLRCLLFCVYLLTRDKITIIQESAMILRISGKIAFRTLCERGWNLIDTVSLWSGLTLNWEGNSLCLTRQILI